MKVLVYGRHAHPDGFRAVNAPANPAAIPVAVTALATGFRAVGHSSNLRSSKFFNPDDLERADCVAVLGLHGAAGKIKEAYESKGVPVLVLDLGFYRRDLGYFQLGAGRLNDICNVDCDDSRAKQCGLIAGDYAAVEGGPILLLGQLQNDKAHGIRDMRAWATNAADTLSRLHKLPVAWRPHPQQVFEIPGVSRFDDPREVTLARSLQGCSAVATYNSTSAFEAMVAGVPVLSDACAPYAAVSGRLASSEITRFDKSETQAFLNRVAYSQWLPTELESGAFFDTIKDRIENHKPTVSVALAETETERARLESQVAALESRITSQAEEIARLTSEVETARRDAEEARRSRQGRKGRG